MIADSGWLQLPTGAAFATIPGALHMLLLLLQLEKGPPSVHIRVGMSRITQSHTRVPR